MSDQTSEERIASRIDKSITSELAVRPTGALAAANVDQLMELAKMMAVAQVAIPKHLRSNPGACLAIAIQASEWEMSPFAVANKSYVVNDRIAFEAQLINAVILRRAPIIGRFKVEYRGEDRTRRCKVWANVRDPETGQAERVEYESPEIGRIPVQNSPLWKGDPDQQLFYYSSRAMCRRHFPDVILGIYTPEEMAEAIDIQTQTIPLAKIGQPKTEEPSKGEQFLRDAQTAPSEKKSEPQSVTEAAQQEQKTPEPEMPTEKGGQQRQAVSGNAEGKVPTAAPKKVMAAGGESAPPAFVPSAKELIAQIMKKTRVMNMGKAVVTARLLDAGLLKDGQTIDDLDAKTAANVLDAWEQITLDPMP